MKQSIILLFILLIFNFSTLANAEVVAIYDWEGTKNDSDIYIGEVNSNGARDGNGIYLFKNGEKYVGRWINNEFSGHGLKVIENEDKTFDRYKGQNYRGNSHGYGVYYWSSTYYLGEFKTGKYNSFEGNCGVYKYNNGNSDEYYCFEKGKWIKQSFININKINLAKKKSKKAQAALSIASDNMARAYKILNEYKRQWPFATLNKKTLCLRSTDLNGRWEQTSSYLNYVKEAKKRSLSEKLCSPLTGRTLSGIFPKWESEPDKNTTDKKNTNADSIILIWFGIIMMFIITIYMIHKNLKSKKLNSSLKTKVIEKNIDEIKIISKEKIVNKFVSDSLMKDAILEEDIEFSTSSKDPVLDLKSDTKTIKSETANEVTEDKVEVFEKIDEIEPLMTKQKKDKKIISTIKITELTKIRTKICDFCETENFGDKTICMICNKSLA